MNNIGLGKDILTYLEEFGLTEKEVYIYLTLLKTGPSTIMDLARKTEIKRSTTHNNVEELIKKGLISQTNHAERRMVIAENPEKLKFLLEQRKWEVEKLDHNMDNIVSSILKLVPNAVENSRFEVKYYEGKQEVEYVYNLSLKASEVHSFADLDKYYQIFPETRDLWKNALDKNTKREVWDIVVESDISKDIYKNKHKRYHIKFLPKKYIDESLGFSDYIIFEDTIAIIQLDLNKPLATVIESKQIASTLKMLHRFIWDLSK